MTIQITDLISKLIDKLEGWIEELFIMLPNLALAVFVLLFFILLARLSTNLLQKVLPRFSDQVAVNRILSSLLYISIFAIGSFIALEVMNLDGTVKSLLAGAGILGLAIGIAFQDLFTNFISGVVIAFKKPYKIGDLVETNGFMGEVREINMRTTTIRLFQGQDVIIPNKDLFQKPLKNYSTGVRRIDLEVGVSYGDDLQLVESVACEAISSISNIDLSREVKVFYTSFGNSSINLVIQYWIDLQRQQSFLQSRSEGIKAIKESFDEHNISIPFPIRTLDFGIKGGKNLKNMLEVHTDRVSHN